MGDYDRRNVTFRQAEGLDCLPTPLALAELTEESRALMWAAIYPHLSGEAYKDKSTGWELWISPIWHLTLRAWHVKTLHRPVDEYDPSFRTNVESVKKLVFNWQYDYLFDFLTFVMREGYLADDFDAALSKAFSDGRVAYSVNQRTIYPTATPEEADTIQGAFVSLGADEFLASREHLREAGRLLSGGRWADSVRESIYSVESVARVIEPGASTLSDALKVLTNKRGMNPNLKRGLEALYNYTTDEKGIRHAKIFDQNADVDDIDAIYMFGACAAFISFLINKHRK